MLNPHPIVGRVPGAWLLTWGLWAYAALSSTADPAQLLAGAVVIAAVLAAARFTVRRPLAGAGTYRLAVAVRQRVDAGARLPRLFDPDAAGSPRPRAPGLAAPAA